MRKILCQFLLLLFFATSLSAQDISVGQYVEAYKDMAIREMKRMGIPAAITLAQGILETQNGNSDLVKKSNNHFGIKCKSSWTAGGVSHDDDAPGECFRVYKNAEESYRDHSNFLRGSERYSALFKLDPRDYKAWARGLRKAGYATNPKYPDVLIKNIEDNNLQQYTLIAAGEVPVFDASKYTDDREQAIPNEEIDGNSAVRQTQVKEGSELIVNGVKAINAGKGTSLLAIATRYDINLTRLLEFNDLPTDGLLESDQLIFLQKKQKEGDQDSYIVHANETLRDVAQKNGVQLESIYAYNNLSSGAKIFPGAKIFLKPGQQTDTEDIADTRNLTSNIHEVGPREGLYGISKRYHVTVPQLREWNRLTNDDLYIGQKLIISK